MGDQLINIKYRDGRKNFKLYKGAEKVFYNINSIVGYDECIITEGEMDVLALHEAGIKNAISVPNGATLNTNNLDYLDNCIDYFEDKEKIILAVDSDDAGQALQQELVRRLGAEVCYLADFEECKDANEYLIKYGKEKLADWQSVLPELDRYRLRMLQRSVILKMKLLTLLRMALSRDIKLAYQILMTYFQLTLVNLLLSLASLVPVRVTLSIKW
jgi:5S rRNA maturation endonuclease (ribonuclease M5)